MLGSDPGSELGCLLDFVFRNDQSHQHRYRLYLHFTTDQHIELTNIAPELCPHISEQSYTVQQTGRGAVSLNLSESLGLEEQVCKKTSNNRPLSVRSTPEKWWAWPWVLASFLEPPTECVSSSGFKNARARAGNCWKRSVMSTRWVPW